MPRKEYNRFMVLVKDKLPPHKYLQNYSLENYPVHYIKIADDRITIQTPSLTGTNITTGAFLMYSHWTGFRLTVGCSGSITRG